MNYITIWIGIQIAPPPKVISGALPDPHPSTSEPVIVVRLLGLVVLHLLLGLMEKMEIGELQVPAGYTYNKALRWMGVDCMHLSPGEDGELQVPAGYNIRHPST